MANLSNYRPVKIPQCFGIRCPNPECGKIRNYKYLRPTPINDATQRAARCKACGTVFFTQERVIGWIENHSEKLRLPVS